jgi:hypothetical protein
VGSTPSSGTIPHFVRSDAGRAAQARDDRFAVVSGLDPAATHGAAPRNARHECLAATYANARLLLKRLRQQINVLDDFLCSEWNGHVTVQYRRQFNRPTPLVARPARNQREDTAIGVDAIQKRQLNVRCVRQTADNLSDIQQRTVCT